MAEPEDLAAETLAAVRRAVRSDVARRPGSARRGFGVEPVYTGSGADERDPKPIEVGVSELVEDRGWKDRVRVASIIGRWDEIVGNSLAEHVVPVEYRADEKLLVLGAESTAWATQVRMLSTDLLRRLDQILGSGMVTDLRVDGPKPPRQQFGRWSVPGRGPRDTYG